MPIALLEKLHTLNENFEDQLFTFWLSFAVYDMQIGRLQLNRVT